MQLDPRQARLWHYFNHQDDFWPIRDWPQRGYPSRFRDFALSAHLSNPERYQFARFLLFNGLPPSLLRHWVLATDADNRAHPPRLLSSGYDDAAIQHIKQMRGQHRRADPTFYGGRTYDLTEGRPVAFRLRPPGDF